MKGLLLLAARPKGKSKGAPADEAGAPESERDGESKDTSSSVEAYAREAFSALREDDEDGFVEAFKGAMGCRGKSDESEEG